MKFCVKFKNRKFHIIFDVDNKSKFLNLNTILSMNMTYNGCEKINIR